jgi:hypothetical protein
MSCSVGSRSGSQVGGEVYVEGLVAVPVRGEQPAEVPPGPGGEAGFLLQFGHRELCLTAGLPGLPATLREFPGALPDRVPVLLDQPEPVVLPRQDHHEVPLLHHGVLAERAVRVHDVVDAQPQPRTLERDPSATPLDAHLAIVPDRRRPVATT